MNTIKTVGLWITGVILVSLIWRGINYTLLENQLKTDKPVISSQDARDTFNQECIDPDYGTDASYCNCVYDDLEQNYGVNGITKMGLEYARTNEIPQAMQSAADRCI